MKRYTLLLLATLAAAHPMGNFSVSHYTRLRVTATGVDINYVLDLAEVPAFELAKEWKLDAAAPQSVMDAHALEQAREWMKGLEFSNVDVLVHPDVLSATAKITPQPGGLFTLRIASVLRLPVAGDLRFRDNNYPDRPGWKEIVIDAAPGAAILTASQSSQDRSQALTDYSQTNAPPPQDLRAEVEWRPGRAAVPEKIAPIPQPPPVVIATAAENPPATPQQHDLLSRILAQRDLTLGIILIAMAVAFGLGAIHAISPGHGKTIVAAYLVGSRGTMRHAAFLGGMVTFTHTASVFALGLATLFLSEYFVPERLARTLEVISGLSIIAIGLWLFYQRIRQLRAPTHHHHHDHHPHHHDHHHHHHHHDQAHTHSHVPEGDVTLGSLIALGASGGLVPCPSAMVLLLFAISVGRVGLGLLLLVAFSVGLAGVLMAIGMLVLYAKHWLPDPERTSRHGAFRFLPVVSAAVIVCIGLVMTGVSIR
ncbi:MAG TPA: sulfite exporter TauE/SafE family protein [Bryobacteraceae bacterium]|nr:sulfite exporter TauE/SafE family protein [Bryobacteraceae bacterium]